MRKIVWTLRFSFVLLLVFSLFFALIFFFALFCVTYDSFICLLSTCQSLNCAVRWNLVSVSGKFTSKLRVKIAYGAILQFSGTYFWLQRICPEIMKPNVLPFTFTYISLGSLLDFREFSLKSNVKMPVYSSFTPYIFCIISCIFFLW